MSVNEFKEIIRLMRYKKAPCVIPLSQLNEFKAMCRVKGVYVRIVEYTYSFTAEIV